MNNALPGTIVEVASPDAYAGPQVEEVTYKPEGWMHWSIRGVYNMMYFTATSVSFATHGMAGSDKGDPQKYQAGYWKPPTVSNN
jgi:hypothetical protein